MQSNFITDFKTNIKWRDFFLDFMACLVPGLIFLVASFLLAGGIIFIYSKELILSTLTISNEVIKELLKSFGFNMWFFFIVAFLAYFAGHLLYRQSPKRPDYASFLRIRDKVMKDDDWVIEKGKGVKTKDVQFPYSNLNHYLQKRGFTYLYDDQKGSQRSKTLINKLKIRIAFFHPEHTLNIIRNEAHIRLASSMWYAAKYVLRLSYYCNVVTLIYLLLFIHFSRHSVLFYSIAFLTLVFGKLSRWQAIQTMKKFSDENTSEKEAIKATINIDRYWQCHDILPLICCGILFVFLIMSVKYEYLEADKLDIVVGYLALHIFIILGSLFSKRRIEETIHYQRVREILYVLETGYIANLINDIKISGARLDKNKT